ncbi:MAG: TolC family protein [Sandaracinus sp.]|nr:TolC family protein [Sandaracinus sp.]MCB9612498.1 TolC family protein [Sandaracinus sp.]
MKAAGLATLLCLVALVPARAQDDAPPTDLATLLERAEARYPALRANEAAIRAARARLDEARFSPFFQIDAQGGLTIAPRAEGTPIFSNQDQLPLDNGWAPVAEIGVRGAIPLYTFGKLRNAWRAGRAGIRAAELDAERSRARLRYDVRRAYFALQLALDIRQMIREGRGQLDRAVRKLDELIAEGDPDVNPMDRFRLRAALAEVDARSSQAERLEASSRAALETLTGETNVRIPDCPIAPVVLDDAALSEADSTTRPELGMLEAAIEARRAAVEIQRGSYGPDVGLGFTAGISWGPGITDQENPFVSDPANRPSLGAGLVMRWSLDFVGQTYRVRRARAQLEETQARGDEARLGLQLEVDLSREALRDAMRREEAWGRGERDTRAWLVSAAQAYDIGAAEPKDLVDALKAYFEARFSHLQAVHDVNVAAAELSRVTGGGVSPTEGWEAPCD